MPFLKILLVEDSPADSRLLWEMLRESGIKNRFSLDPAVTLKDALSQLSSRKFDLVLLDLMLPDSSGLDTFRAVHKAYPDVPVVLLTGLSDETLAARAVREGAQDYLVKGQVDAAVLVRSMRYAIERHVADRSFKPAHKASEDVVMLCPDMIGSSPALKEVRSLIETVARTSNTSVLIMGETGTGKELVANSIHYLSSRRYGPFIKLNCSAIPDTLMESELFGYEKGAFTDARQSKKGLFELADGGTIFLDEIGDMDLRLQPKLLQILENRTLRKLGGVADMKIDVRVIAATNVDLSEMVRAKRFREDLYYRLNVMAINLPPLRERREDIVALAEHFINENKDFEGEEGQVKKLCKESASALENYGWPGNIRELKNIIERAMILAGPDEIRSEHLQISAAPSVAPSKEEGPPGYSMDMSLDDLEKAHIRNVLEKTGGNITHASKVLGISRYTLREKLKKYGLREAEDA
ncbi:MAG: sigma-54-dependent Fis family transcriptional regulator [Deltaproteobacteria bacterium]|nr:sigma-54-dependent Fis family transcriptional regulator [Deltaproteobacteria bacterium]